MAEAGTDAASAVAGTVMAGAGASFTVTADFMVEAVSVTASDAEVGFVEAVGSAAGATVGTDN